MRSVQEGFDPDFADSMATCTRKAIIHPCAWSLTSRLTYEVHGLCEVKQDECDNGHDNFQKITGQFSFQDTSLLAMLVRFVTKKCDTAVCDAPSVEGMRKVMRTSILCCDVARACIQRADEIMSQFSLCISLSAKKQLKLCAAKLVDMG